MAVALLIATPAAIASSGDKVDSFADRPGMSLKSGWAAKGASESASFPLRVNFDKALRCLALNIYHEARSEPRAGQIAVASVTLNRVKSKRFPGTVCDVVMQGGKSAIAANSPGGATAKTTSQ
jgi:spore germination cell wall hydrolase CwlJ-like protein